MPFTPSHAAAVLPLLRTPLPASALVIGSVSPDLPYYLPGAPAWPTHSAVAVVTTDLALGVLAWVLWHALVSAAVLHLAPRPLRARLAGRVRVGLRCRAGGLSALALVVVALVVGAATHVGWDEFTHAGRWGTGNAPALSRTWFGLEGFRWAQYGSGVGGLVVLSVWCRRWWHRAPVVPVPGRRGAAAVWGVLVGASTVAGLLAAGQTSGARAWAFAGATTGGAVLLLGLTSVALVLRFTASERR
ncbi:DUF4184 family protein [Kineococcus sp. R8]|uniref:DUF4184 family protein n=1 Tax=Kineococcus siccus TaxID=2696567 RepID=UPI001411CD60|nr:DUF4184 family protein [Kineococcus siccus]